VTDSYTYSPYGYPTSPPASAPDPNPFRYGGSVGYYTDPGQQGLVLCGQRWYAPSYARWLSRDPEGYGGGANLYGYCGDNPVGAVDPSGEAPSGAGLLVNAQKTPAGKAAVARSMANWTGGVAVVAGIAGGSMAVAEAVTSGAVIRTSIAATGALSAVWNSVLSRLPWPPNNGFAGVPVNVTMNVGQNILRYGPASGRFFTNVGYSTSKCALKPGSDMTPTVYEVLQPFEVQAGYARAWFGQPGGAPQYLPSRSIQWLEDNEFIKKAP